MDKWEIKEFISSSVEVVMRLDKFISNMGLGTRTEVKKMISKGRVTVNEEVIRKAGYIVNPDSDEIQLDEMIVAYDAHVYIVMNKPVDVISATADSRHETVIDLVRETYGNRKLFPVGRLDIDTEGMILITDDGKWSHDLMLPKKHVKKKYFAHVAGVVTEKEIELFKSGVTLIDETLCQPGKLEIISVEDGSSKIHLTITEGKFHQVKRMFEAVDMEVLYLKRVKIGGLSLDETIELGDYRELTDEELEKIKLED